MAEPADNQVFLEVLGENNAQSVLREIQTIENQRSLLVTRWIWELVQNARGTARGTNALWIVVESKPGLLIFRHNGEQFREKEIAHLILHGSTKSDRSEIGRFGTGFITTHLLSREIEIRGSLQPSTPFRFQLNRGGATAGELRSAMELSWHAYQASLTTGTEPLDTPFTTEFRYPISPSVKDAVEAGILSLRNAAPYLFAFNPMLRRLDIIQADSSDSFSALENSRTIAPKIGVLRVRRNEDSPINIFHSQDSPVIAAIAVSEPAGGPPRLVSPEKIPRLFIAFPLNGMERFPLPIVLNSEEFYPYPDRDGIPLSEGDSEQNRANKMLLADGCDRIVELLALASKNKWACVPESLEIVGDAHVRGAAPDEWLKRTIRDKVVEGLRRCPLVTTIDGTWVEPAESWIPMPSGKCGASRVWSLAAALKGARSKLPQQEDFGAWGQTVTQWRKFAASNEGEWPESLKIDGLAHYVSMLGTLERLIAEFESEERAVTWLSAFYDAILISDDASIFARSPIVPDQDGVLRRRDQLFRDDSIGDDLKAISATLGTDIRSKLVDVRLGHHRAFEILPKIGEDRVISDLLSLNKKLFIDPADTRLREANVDLFGALVRRLYFSKLDGFPVATLPNSQGRRQVVVLNASVDLVRRPLAPIAAWPLTAQPFADAFPESAVLDTEYYSRVPGDVWSGLSAAGLMHQDPIFFSEKPVSRFLPDEPLPDDEKDVKSEAKARLSNVAWGAIDQSSIFERSRTSAKRSLLLLEFFLEHASAVDANGLTVASARCDNGKDHRFYPAEWLAPLRDRKWVFAGTKKYDGPTVGSLAQLFKESPVLLARLNDARVSELFRAIGVSPPEIMLRSLGASDADRMSLIRSISDISIAVGNDPTRVQELARALKDDPEAIDMIAERRLGRERIAQNQTLGEMVEQVFAQVLGENMKVVRTGPGHDYMLLDAGQVDGGIVEIKESCQSVFVEIKATTGTSVRMSQLQGTEAVKNSDRYVLCVVPIDTFEFSAEAFKQRARFVFSISRLLQPAWTSYANLNAAHKSAYSGTDITLEVGPQEVKFRIDQPAWNQADDFEAALARLRKMVVPS